jgi:hypothetical protein
MKTVLLTIALAVPIVSLGNGPTCESLATLVRPPPNRVKYCNVVSTPLFAKIRHGGGSVNPW